VHLTDACDIPLPKFLFNPNEVVPIMGFVPFRRFVRGSILTSVGTEIFSNPLRGERRSHWR